MNSEDLFDAFSGVEDDLLERSGERRKPRKALTRAIAAAASFAVLVAGGFAVRWLRNPETPALIFNEVTEMTSSEPLGPVEAHRYEEPLTEEELAAAGPEALADWMEVSGSAYYYGWGELDFVRLRFDGGAHEGAVVVTLSRGRLPDLGCIVIETPEPTTSRIGDLELAVYRRDHESGVEYWAEFEIGEVFYCVRTSAGTEEAELAERDFYEVLSCYQTAAALDLDSFQMRESHLWIDRADLTVEEALADGDFGAYFPQNEPQGLALGSICRFKTEEYGNWLSASWRGEESGSMEWVMFRPGEAYEVGWWFEGDPMIPIGELTWEVFRAQSEEPSVRMSLTVLYGNVAVHVTAYGVGAEWLYEQLISVE